MSDYAYEYIFTGSFDEDIFNQGSVHDPELLSSVSSCVDIISTILNFNTGVNSFSSFVSYNDVNYKVTVNKL